MSDNDSPGQKKSAGAGFVVILAVILIALAGKCANKQDPTTPSPAPVISIK